MLVRSLHRLMFKRELLNSLMKGLGRLISEHGSAPLPDAVSNEDNDIRRTQCWVDVVGGKKKRRVYGAGQLVANYTSLLQQRDQECRDLRDKYSELRDKFTNFKSLKLHTFIPSSLRPSHDPSRHPLSLSSPHQSSPHQSTPHQSTSH
ncbi:hypothetical protein LR48_Vigan09g087300 [Vigna angularis]|uniref:Uncharacterized protein n=1 Tax=Phaseolus angularis TaxID=3914 RepID=A0A0L9VC23_PHAAN|nr:hypothetical protein LR48_Vigan09g087300 [Vigna angularis]